MRTTFFALAALPFFAIAQDPVPEPIPTTSEVFVPPPAVAPTTTSEAIFIPETTPEVIPEDPETTAQVPDVQDTTTVQPFVQDTTSQVPPPPSSPDTTTEQLPPPQDTTTQQFVPVVDTTTGIPPVVDTTTGPAPVVDTSTELPPQIVDTTTGPAPIDTTTGIPSVDTSTELPPQIVDTTTEIPPVDTTGPAPVDTTTELPPPVVDTTTGPAPIDTSTELPPQIVDTTTEAPAPPPQTTTEEAPAQDTTTAVDQQPAETTQPEPKPTSEEEAKPTTKEDGQEPSSKEEESPVITQAPAPTTAPPEATASVSSVSSQIASLIPVINKWKDDPESLKDETNKEVEDTHDDIIAVIVALGGSPDVGCSNKKRGLLGPIGDVINKLACMAEDLTKVSGGIIAGNVPAVTGAVSGVQGKNDELTDEQQDDDDDDDDDDKTEEKSEEQSTKEKSTEAPTTTEVPTTTEAPTTTEESTTEATTTTGMPVPCASGICGSSCPMSPGPGKDGEMSNEGGGVVDCKDVPTTTTDGPLPTKPGNFEDPFNAPPTSRPDSSEKRDVPLPLQRRTFADDTSPNAAYIGSLNPVWVSQQGDTSGHWFNAPGPAGKGSAGVNGIYGCTAVMIVSNVGTYLSHIWENPVFIDGDWNFKPDDEFEAKAFNALRDGTADGNALSVTSLIGTDENPGVLHSINEPKVFIVTPFTSPADTALYGITTFYRYEQRANDLASKLAGIIPGSTSQVLGYTRTDKDQSTDMFGYLGRAIVEFDMLDQVLQSAEEDELLGLGMAMGRWRLWVEDYLITSHQFFVFPPPAAPAGGQQKRADEDAAHSCLVRGDSTATASSGPTSTEAVTSTEAPTEAATSDVTSTDIESTDASVGPTSTEDTETTETSASSTTETKNDSATATETTTEETTTTAGQTTTSPPTTLMTSFITTTSAPDTTSDTYTGPYPCVNVGGPRVETPHCQCSTTTAGQVFVTTAALISGQCHYYHEYPSPVTLAPTEAPPPPEPTPFTTTMDNGAILAYPDQTVKVGNYPGGHYTYTEGSGTASTVRPADPVQTDGNNKGSSQCHSIDNACDRAIDNFKDDVIYTEFASYYARIKSGFIIVPTFGQAGCVVEFDCDDWSVGGLNGKQIKEEYQYMKDNTGVSKCGTGYMSNTCRVTANYCTNCNERHQKID